MSGADRYPLLTAADAVDLITQVKQLSGVDNLGLLADLYAGDEVAPGGQVGTPEPRLTERLVERVLKTGARISPIEGAANGA